MDMLFNIFKVLLLIVGCLVLIDIIIAIIVTPIKNRKRKKELLEFTDKILKEMRNEDQNQPKKQTKKPRNTKKNEDN